MNGRIIGGFVLVALGVLFLLDQADYLEFGQTVGRFWPVLLIVIGVAQLATRPTQYVAPLVLLALGAFFLLVNLGFLPRDWWSYLWPLVLILIGLALLLPRRHWQGRGEPVTSERFSRTAVLGGFEERVHARPFRGAAMTAILGGGKLDLREAELAPEGADIDVTAIMGGVEVLVPPSWTVQVAGTPILGGVDNKTTKPAQSGRTLRVRATAIMGGVEIKN